jgi:GntR family transcriptional regulator
LNAVTGQVSLDFRSDEPIYLQIVRQIQELIASGALKTGDQLPTVREVATELRVNFNTVARAYRVLDEMGLISTQRGRGTYIWSEPTGESMRQVKQDGLKEIAQRYLTEAEALGFTAQEALQMVDALIRSADMHPSDSQSDSAAKGSVTHS